MRIRTAAIPATAAICAVILTQLPATAADTADTTVTFTVTATTYLGITAPASASLSSVAPGGQATGQLGTVAVNDQRSQLNTTWTCTVSLSTPFTTGGGTAAETITGAGVTYTPGSATAEVNPPHTAGTAGTLGSSRTAFSRTSGNGANSVSWNPALTVNVPAAAVSGDYTGVVTHSVA